MAPHSKPRSFQAPEAGAEDLDRHEAVIAAATIAVTTLGEDGPLSRALRRCKGRRLPSTQRHTTSAMYRFWRMAQGWQLLSMTEQAANADAFRGLIADASLALAVFRGRPGPRSGALPRGDAD